MTAARVAEWWVEAAHTLNIVLHEAPWGFVGSQLLSVCMPVTVHGFGPVQAHSKQSRSVPKGSIGMLKQALQLSRRMLRAQHWFRGTRCCLELWSFSCWLPVIARQNLRR